jgi:hypothetical protein
MYKLSGLILCITFVYKLTGLILCIPVYKSHLWSSVEYKGLFTHKLTADLVWVLRSSWQWRFKSRSYGLWRHVVSFCIRRPAFRKIMQSLLSLQSVNIIKFVKTIQLILICCLFPFSDMFKKSERVWMFHPEVGVSMVLWNVGIVAYYTMSQSRRPQRIWIIHPKDGSSKVLRILVSNHHTTLHNPENIDL